MGDVHFIIDQDKEMACNFGEWYPHDGQIIINLSLIDSPEEVMITIIHEVLHDQIDWAVAPYETKEKQDHYIIPRMLC